MFTHKSFGEYLAARRIARAVEKVVRELERRDKNSDEGWDERDALRHWAQVCGPSAMSSYLHAFLLNEMKLHSGSELAQWQGGLAKLFSCMLRYGMPMEQLQLGPFREGMFQSRNAEEALLVALNACARVTEQVSIIQYPDRTTFGAWFKRIQGQRTSGESVLAARCLSFLDLHEAVLHFGDFIGADFFCANLQSVKGYRAAFEGSNLGRANLREAHLLGAHIEGARLKGANLEGAHLEGASLIGASLVGANLRERPPPKGRPRGSQPRRSRPAGARSTSDEPKGHQPPRSPSRRGNTAS